MTLTDRQQACDLWCIDNPDEPPFCAPQNFTLTEVLESRARIASKRKCACAYNHTKVQAEILSDVTKLADRCRTAESDLRAARSLLREQDKRDGLVIVLLAFAFIAGMMVMALIHHMSGG